MRLQPLIKTLLLSSGLALSSLACAEKAAEPTYADHSEAHAFIKEMHAKHGFDEAAMTQWFADAKRKTSILEAIARPAERTLTWKEYRNIFLKPQRIEQGREFLQTHAALLARAEAEYGVAKEIITAIIGVETYYGQRKGSFRVMDALSTLAFDYPPRSAFFRKELEQFLLLTREQQFEPLSLTGSYAGAMGYGQFIPSSYRAYAVDFDGDAQADIWNNVEDAVGSVANYLARHRWQPGAPVATPVTVRGDGYRQGLQTKLQATTTLGQLQGLGVDVPVQLAPDTATHLMELQGKDGAEHWVGFPNFYVITRYNHSRLYAMAVYQLSQAIAEAE